MNNPTAYDGVTSVTRTVTVTDDDTIGLDVPDLSVTVNEGGTATFRVKLNTVPTGDVTVGVSSADVNKATVSTASLTFTTMTWNAYQTVTVTGVEDDDRADETVEVTLDPGGNDYAGAEDVEVQVSVDDNEAPAVTVNFELDSYTVEEGNTVTVKVTVDRAPERQLVLPLSVTNEGGADDDDHTVPASVTIGSTQTSATFVVRTTEDTDNDDGEYVTIDFDIDDDMWPEAVNEGATASTQVKINDDDDPKVQVEFGDASYTVKESDDDTTMDEVENQVTFTVELSENPQREVTIPIVVMRLGGATTADYTGVPTSVVFGASDTKKSFTFTATHDTDDDDEDQVKLSIGSPLPVNVSAGSVDEMTISIEDDDWPAITVTYSAGASTVDEGAHRTIQVTLSNVPERAISIPITATPLAGADADDFMLDRTTVNFGENDRSMTVRISPTDDDDDDDDEQVRLGFGTPLPARVTAGANPTELINIGDNDHPIITVQFKATTYTAMEGGAIATVAVQISADPERSIEIGINAMGHGGRRQRKRAPELWDAAHAGDRQHHQPAECGQHRRRRRPDRNGQVRRHGDHRG